MELDDIKISTLTCELEDNPDIHGLLKELLKVQYRVSYDRFGWGGEGSANDLDEQERGYKIVENAEFLDWQRDHPPGHSTISLSPVTLELRLPAPMPNEDIAAFLRRLTSRLDFAVSEAGPSQ